MAETTLQEVMAELHSLGSPSKRQHDARVGIPVGAALGVSTADVRRLGREIGPNQGLAEQLWRSTTHEARILAVLIAEPGRMDEAALQGWLADVGSWDLCDHFCKSLVCRTAWAEGLAIRWCADSRLYVRRAGLATIACLAVHRSDITKQALERFFPAIQRAALDDRMHVRKAASWALREMGKLDFESHDLAIACASDLLATDSKAARWVARHALRELHTLVQVPERRRLLTSKSKTGAKMASSSQSPEGR